MAQLPASMRRKRRQLPPFMKTAYAQAKLANAGGWVLLVIAF